MNCFVAKRKKVENKTKQEVFKGWQSIKATKKRFFSAEHELETFKIERNIFKYQEKIATQFSFYINKVESHHLIRFPFLKAVSIFWNLDSSLNLQIVENRSVWRDSRKKPHFLNSFSFSIEQNVFFFTNIELLIKKTQKTSILPSF